MLRQRLNSALQTFSQNVKSVTDLMQFDTAVLEFVLQHLRALDQRLEAAHGDNSRLRVMNTIALLQNIRKNDSLQPHYREMLNQCNVLLVSYFASAVGDVFRAGVTEAVKTESRPKLLKEEIKITLGMVPDIGGDLVERAADLLLSTNRDINLQNMQSIAVAFRDYFDYDRKQGEVFNDITLSHACRHVIVHNGAIVDHRMIGQLRAASPRTLKQQVQAGERIQFTEQEVQEVANRMITYLGELAEAVVAAMPARAGTSGTDGTPKP